MKRSRIRFRSKKRAKLMRSVAQREQEFLREHPRCWFCDQPSSGIHHMASGSHREKAIEEECTWASSCTRCNQYEVTDAGKWPLARQLALKWMRDLARFSLERFNELRGRAPDAISMAEVKTWIRREMKR